MTIQEIKNIIKKQIGNNYFYKNAHNVDIKKCLIEPIKEKYILSSDFSTEIFLWTVLEEDSDKTGHKIVYNEVENKFGLGILSIDNKLIYLGNYGNFMETLIRM